MAENEIITREDPQMRFAANYGSAHARSKSTETQERFLFTKSEGRYSISRATYTPCLKDTITRYPRNYNNYG